MRTTIWRETSKTSAHTPTADDVAAHIETLAEWAGEALRAEGTSNPFVIVAPTTSVLEVVRDLATAYADELRAAARSDERSDEQDEHHGVPYSEVIAHIEAQGESHGGRFGRM